MLPGTKRLLMPFFNRLITVSEELPDLADLLLGHDCGVLEISMSQSCTPI